MIKQMNEARLLLLFFIFVPVSIGYAADSESSKTSLNYEVIFEIIGNGDLQKLLKDNSRTLMLKEKPPATLSFLERRVELDIPRMSRIEQLGTEDGFTLFNIPFWTYKRL